MVLQETIDNINQLYAEGLQHITIERLVIGVFFTGVKLSNGYAGISYTPVAEMHDDVRHASPIFTKNSPARFKGMPVKDILNNPNDTPMLKTVKIVVLNALSAKFLDRKRYFIIEGKDALDCTDYDATKRIGMVGAFPPFLQRLRKIKNIQLSVIERKRESLTPDDAKYFVPAEDASSVIPLCGTLIITGASIANGTIDDLLNYAGHDAQIIVTGPTASFLPDAFFRRNVGTVSGVLVVKPDEALDMLSEGVGAYHLYKGCVKKINVLKEYSANERNTENAARV